MQTLRNAPFLARLMLAWFALYLGAAVASPMVAPQGFEVVCTAVGMAKLIVHGDGDGGVAAADDASMDCPLCVPGGAPPLPGLAPKVQPAQPLAYATWPIPAARIAALTAAPLPARGPPDRA